jgi:adenosylhomocysteine nucleosidase
VLPWHRASDSAFKPQYLIGLYPSVELAICAGAAGSLATELSIGDVVIGTETVEHHYLAVREATVAAFPWPWTVG